jgi:hypothetical protein
MMADDPHITNSLGLLGHQQFHTLYTTRRETCATQYSVYASLFNTGRLIGEISLQEPSLSH